MHLLALLGRDVGTSDMSMKVRRFAQLVGDRRKEGASAGMYLRAYNAMLRAVQQRGFIRVTAQLAGTPLIIGSELTQHELSSLNTGCPT